MGEEILNETERVRWGLAFRAAGGLPYVWGVLARPMEEVIYGLLELKAGDRVLVLGESTTPTGWVGDITKLIQPGGTVDEVDIQPEGRRRTENRILGRNGKFGTWDWTEYTKDVPDNTYDAIALMQATQHADDWNEMSDEFTRILKPGSRIVIAEANNNGHLFHSRVRSDVHLWEWYDKIMGDNVITPQEIPFFTADQIAEYFKGKLESPQVFEWKGIETFWGRKPVA
jgi:SAM-dependent methyltransferase